MASNDYTIDNSRDSYDPDRTDARGGKPRSQQRTSEQYDDEETYSNGTREVEQPRKDFVNGWETSPERDEAIYIVEGPPDKDEDIVQQARTLKHVEEVQKFYRTDHGYHQDDKILIE